MTRPRLDRATWTNAAKFCQPLPSPGTKATMSTDLTKSNESPDAGTVTAARTHHILPIDQMLKPGYDGPLVVGTLDLTSDDGIEWYLASAGAVDIDREMATQEWFPVSYWVAEKKPNIAKEGDEPKEGVVVVLFSPDGTTFGFSGCMPHESFRKIRQIYGDGPWTTPLWFNAREVRLPGSRSSYILIARSKKPGV